MSPRVGASSFCISETTLPPPSLKELEEVIGLIKKGIEDVKQYKEQAAMRQPANERAAFRKKLEMHLEILEEKLGRLTALRDRFPSIRYQIDDLTAQFKEHRTAYLADLETFRADRDHVQKSNQVFSATLQQTTFSLPTSSNKAYSAAHPVSFMTSPAEKKIEAAEQRWRDHAKKVPPEEQETYLDAIDKVRVSLLRQYGAEAGSRSSRIESPRRPGEPDPLDKSIEIIDKTLNWEYSLPLETE